MAKLAEAEQAIVKYYSDADILEYFFATNCAGKSLRPLVAGAAMFDEERQMLDLHFVNFKYRKSYIKRLLGNDETKNNYESAFSARQQTIECLYPTLIENSRCVNSSDKTQQSSKE